MLSSGSELSVELVTCRPLVKTLLDPGYMQKQPVAWKEYRAEYWLKEL